jgi:alpha-D-ribose 1-methylphosphonate 5-triphosphate synthase subunit PhnL
MSEPVLAIRELRKSFTQHLHGGRRREVLRGVDLEVEAGSCTVVVGPSGCGKSSLLRCVYGSALVDSGSIVLVGAGRELDVAVAGERAVLAARRDLVALATQFLSVVPRVSALELVRARGLDGPGARELLLRLGLDAELHDLAPATFSGGQRQMLNLALTLAQPQPLLLLDEVTASLDHARRVVALEALLERKRSGAAILAVFHDVPQTPGFVDRVVELREGRIAA